MKGGKKCVGGEIKRLEGRRGEQERKRERREQVDKKDSGL